MLMPDIYLWLKFEGYFKIQVDNYCINKILNWKLKAQLLSKCILIHQKLLKIQHFSFVFLQFNISEIDSFTFNILLKGKEYWRYTLGSKTYELIPQFLNDRFCFPIFFAFFIFKICISFFHTCGPRVVANTLL